jgi:hypothetical protein
MTDAGEYLVVIFKSVHHALRSEKILKAAGVPHKLIPMPRHISSDCGVCLRFSPEHRKQVDDALTGKVENIEICLL